MTDNILNERQQAIDLCLKACVNLYGFVTPRQFLKVFNKYNTPKLLKKELLDNAEILEEHSSKYYEVYENAIISTRVNKSVIDRTIGMQAGKNYYTPTEEEVKLYAKANYYPRTQRTKNLMEYLTKTMKMNVFAAGALVDNLVWLTVTDEPMQKRINLLNKHSVPVKSAAQYTKLAEMIMALNNSTRKWANCGYTPAEMAQAENK